MLYKVENRKQDAMKRSRQTAPGKPDPPHPSQCRAAPPAPRRHPDTRLPDQGRDSESTLFNAVCSRPNQQAPSSRTHMESHNFTLKAGYVMMLFLRVQLSSFIEN